MPLGESFGTLRQARQPAVCGLLFLGGATTDFVPLSAFKSLQISDLCIIAGGILAARDLSREDLIGGGRERAALIAMTVVPVLFLAGAGVSTIVAGLPGAGVDNWLHFALLMLALVPATAAALAAEPRARLWLAGGLLTGATAGAVGYLAEVANGAQLYGSRLSGAFGSDPLMLLLAGIAITLAYLGATVQRGGMAHAIRSRAFLGALGILALILAALAVSRARSAWLGAVVLAPATTLVLTRRLRLTIVLFAAVAGIAIAAYQLGALPSVVSARVDQTLAPNAPDLAARSEVMDRLTTEWTHKPWGVGLNQSSSYLPAYLVLGKTGSAHNVVVNALIEAGPLAALAIVLLPFVLSWWWWIGRSPRGDFDWLNAWPMAGLWGLFAAAQTTPSFYPHAAWITIGALVGGTLSRSDHSLCQPTLSPA